ncbi:MAG: SMP-30/gluconolactonase/LRE family protein, partial [Bauldia sp.]|nr:SMP-30/gluconolactonase/LRE family protein [Bauldia sp.]
MLAFSPINTVRCELGEGPVYDHRRNALWYCDIVGRKIHRHELGAGATREWSFPSEVGSLGVAQSGRLVVALRHTVGLFDPDTESFDEIAAIEAERGPDTRLNDGKVGPDGAFWVGTMDDRGLPVREPLGSLYRVTRDGTVERKMEGVCVSNGLAWTPDGRTMFHSDSSGRWL